MRPPEADAALARLREAAVELDQLRGAERMRYGQALEALRAAIAAVEDPGGEDLRQ